MTQLQTYFGFSHREIKAVVDSLLDERLIEWEEDALRITAYARGRFIESEDAVPRFFRIKEWSRDIVFDLMSFMPGAVQSKRLRGLYAMVELTPRELEKESHTRLYAERSFQENFHKVYKGSRAEIYKISEVDPGERFYLPLSCRFSIDTTEGLQISRVLSDKTFENRLEVAEAISAVLASKDRLNNVGIGAFVDLFDEIQMKRFLNGDRLDFASYVNDVHISPSEQSTGHTIPLIGSLHLPRNKRLILEKLGPNTTSLTESAFWIAPQSRFWARSRSVRSFLRDITAALKHEEISTSEESELHSGVKILLQCGGQADWKFTEVYKNAFPEVYASVGQALAGRVEVLVIPNRVMCALYHYLSDESPMSIPIGFVSDLEDHIEKAMDILKLLADGRAPVYKLARRAPMKQIDGGIVPQPVSSGTISGT